MTGVLACRLGGVPVVVRRWTVPDVGRTILLGELATGPLGGRTVRFGSNDVHGLAQLLGAIAVDAGVAVTG